MSRSSNQLTGDFNIAGGYSTTDGALAEVKIGERNFWAPANCEATFT